MARKSQRLSAGAANSTKTNHKRGASDASALSVRTKKLKATPTKSEYFKDATDEDDEPDVSSSANDEASEFDDASQESPSSDGDDDEYDSEMEDTPKARKKTTPAKRNSATPRKGATESSPPTTTAKNGELWRPGVKAGLGPGKQLIIKKPQARPAGKTPYLDETIHPNTLLFLQELKANNDREWLKMHDAVFRQAEKDWYSFVEKLTERLIEIDDTVPELPVKDVIFRIYRDIRFSPDPTPYKPHFSAAWGGYAHYYAQISPHGRSFVGGGLWHPEAVPTAAMRRDIDRNPARLKAVLMDETMRKEFLKGAPKNERKAVTAFVASNKENALKTKPKGYDADHADIDLLRLRNYTIGCSLREDEVVGEKGLERIASLFAAMKPFINYLNSVVMPDQEDESEDGDEEDEEESE